MARLSIHSTARLSSLSNQGILDITAILSDMKIENDLRRELRGNIQRLREMGSYRGRRHAMGMPVRGQRTRTQTVTATKLNKLDRVGKPKCNASYRPEKRVHMFSKHARLLCCSEACMTTRKRAKTILPCSDFCYHSSASIYLDPLISTRAQKSYVFVPTNSKDLNIFSHISSA